jgi:hypothetical protein
MKLQVGKMSCTTKKNSTSDLKKLVYSELTEPEGWIFTKQLQD